MAAMLRTLMSLAATAMLIELAMAANYTVGGSNGGWDTTTDLQTWASSQSFLAGDNLIFQYPSNHDVLEVSKSDYDSCQASNPVQSHTSSPTIIPLSSPGKRYFICGTIGHCGQGMKLEIDTLATTAPPPASPSTPPPPSPSTPPAASPSTPPPASPVTPPVASPTPELSTPPPIVSPESAPKMSPPSPTKSPMSSPTSSPSVPSAESPTNSPPPSGSSPPPSPSSAYESNFQARLAMGFSFVMMILLAF